MRLIRSRKETVVITRMTAEDLLSFPSEIRRKFGMTKRGIYQTFRWWGIGTQGMGE